MSKAWPFCCAETYGIPAWLPSCILLNDLERPRDLLEHAGFCAQLVTTSRASEQIESCRSRVKWIATSPMQHCLCHATNTEILMRYNDRAQNPAPVEVSHGVGAGVDRMPDNVQLLVGALRLEALQGVPRHVSLEALDEVRTALLAVPAHTMQ